MSARGRSQNSRTSPSESPISRPLNQRQTTTPRTTPIIPRGQDRPRISLERSRSRSENCSRRDVVADSESGPEESSQTFPRASNNSNCSPSILACRTPFSSSPSGRSIPVNTPLSTVNARGSCCDHERQFDALQSKLAALTEKIDNLQGSSTTVVTQRRSENLPRDMVACVHKVVAKLKEKDPPKEWTFEQDHSFNDDANLEVTQAIERGVQATSAFKEADPVLLERAIKTYYKTLKAKSKRVLTRVRREGLPQVVNKQEESVITARRNQRCHNKLKSRRGALRQSMYSEEKKRKLEEVLSIDYMSPEESVYESNSDDDHEGQGRMAKLVVKRFEWRSDELTRELKSLDRKANRARSERGKRMMVKREEGGFVANSLHCHPKSAPAWALSADLLG